MQVLTVWNKLALTTLIQTNIAIAFMLVSLVLCIKCFSYMLSNLKKINDFCYSVFFELEIVWSFFCLCFKRFSELLYNSDCWFLTSCFQAMFSLYFSVLVLTCEIRIHPSFIHYKMYLQQLLALVQKLNWFDPLY